MKPNVKEGKYKGMKILPKATTFFIICFFFSLHFLVGEEHMLQTNRSQEPKPP
jgi:hypothetical protein